MRIRHKDIILRDYQETDITDDIRWMTVETAWQDWDAPWEKDEEFDADQFRTKMLKCLETKPKDSDFRWAFEIDTKDGVHIGGVNSYLIDAKYNWIPGRKGKGLYTLGIDICESSYWYRGYGTQAFSAFILYMNSQGITDLFTQTWSGNLPMLALAKRLGFAEVNRVKNYRVVRGRRYAALTFKLNMKKFNGFFEKG